jgi:hypothetical protein
LQSENRQGSAIVNAVSLRTGCNRAIAIPTIEVGNKESVNDCVAESVILNKYRQHGTIYSQIVSPSYLKLYLSTFFKQPEEGLMDFYSI